MSMGIVVSSIYFSEWHAHHTYIGASLVHRLSEDGEEEESLVSTASGSDCVISHEDQI